MKKIVMLFLLSTGSAFLASAKLLAPPAVAVPEIDPASIVTASALVCAGVLMMRHRRKR